MSGGRIALLVVGIIVLVGGLALMMGGGGLMWLGEAMENDDPWFAARETTFRKADASAIVSEPFEIDWHDESRGDSWGLGDLVTVKVRGEARDPSKAVFIGIASDAEVGRYLSGVQYYEITEWTGDPFDDPQLEYRLHSGSTAPADPTAQTLWAASAHGPGRQTLEWKPEMGRWVLVIMNEDGSAGIDVSGGVGAEVPWLFWLGLALLLTGVALLAAGAVMVYFAARKPKIGPATAPGTGQQSSG
jgi:hypothetical protein